MPLFDLVCKCGHARSCLANRFVDLDLKCPQCTKKMSRVSPGVGSRKVEKLDNGLMSKSVERLDNAEELFRERARTADPLAGGGREK